MEPGMPLTEQALLDALRAHRADLRGSMSELEQALAAPAPGRLPAWTLRVNGAVGELVTDFREHIDITEGLDGLYRELLTTAPRLSKMVARLTREHGQIRDLLDQLQSKTGAPKVHDVARIRDIGTAVLGHLARHRQRGADLVFEAYSVDLGGET